MTKQGEELTAEERQIVAEEAEAERVFQAEKATVTVTALEYHTYNGNEYQAGDTYEIPADLVNSVVVQRKAKRTHEPEPAPAKPSQPVEPLTTDDFKP